MGSILVVDDDGYVLDSVSTLLEMSGLNVIGCRSANEALEKFNTFDIDVVLSDINMPGTTGIQLLEQINKINPEIPVILMTAFAEMNMAVNALKKGAYDFIIKPYLPDHLKHSIDKAIKYRKFMQSERNYKIMLEQEVEKKTMELAKALDVTKHMSRELIYRLTVAAEYKDAYTGAHISRIVFYSKKLAEAMKLSDEFIERITVASAMHDIGKIGIPDGILLKPGPLTKEEFEIIKTHTTIGEKILSGSTNPFVQMAASISLNHHERWDGTGYPNGLKGEEIPVEGRIVIIADQYDALRSDRPYKSKFSHEKTFKIITEGDGRTSPQHFDPAVLKIFIKHSSEFDEIFNTHQD
ncbi:MAG: response regulator [Candidatus Schekmanbacteria bacterium]|nr:response regulator [Candidatus Schekmanbacteria bacterium]